MELYKDNLEKKTITDGEEIEKKELKRLAYSIEDLENILLNGHKLSEFQSNNDSKPVREKCPRSDKEDTNSDNDEERIIRCLYYRSNDKCPNDKCSYKKKYVIDKGCGFVAQDYQVPSDKKVPGVGKIDLVLKNIKDNKLYAVEVKRDGRENNENIVRMIAEILTYTIVTKEYHYGDYKEHKEKMFPAIGFFEGSLQQTNYENLEKNQDLLKIIDSTKLKVYLFKNKHDKNDKPIVDNYGVPVLEIVTLNPDTK